MTIREVQREDEGQQRRSRTANPDLTETDSGKTTWLAGVPAQTGVLGPASLLALQRGVGNDAVQRLLARESYAVQRVPDRPRRTSARTNPYSHQPHSARLREQQGYDGAAPAVAVPRLPSRGPNGEAIWSGTRHDLGFDDAVKEAVYAATATQNVGGVTHYKCGICGGFFPRENTQVDHITGIIAYVHDNVDAVYWSHQGRQVWAILRQDAQAAANDVNNLRILCQPCNGGQRAAHSESRGFDTSKAVDWVG